MSNLYRVTTIPEKVHYARTKLREKKDVHEYCEKVPPFILREGRLFTFSELTRSDTFGPVLSKNVRVSSDAFADWFSDEEYSRRAIELLNVCLKEHAIHLGLTPPEACFEVLRQAKPMFRRMMRTTK